MDDYLDIFFVSFTYIAGVMFLLSLVIPSANIFFHFTVLRNRLKIRYDAEYYRDILNYSPSEILYIYDRNYRDNLLDNYGLVVKYKKMFYINILKMYLLKYIKIDFSNGDDFEIIKNDVIILDEEYKMIYDYIFGIITKESRLLLSDINKYVDDNYNNSFFSKWHELVLKKLRYCGFYTVDFLSVQGDMLKKYYVFVIAALSILELFFLVTQPQSAWIWLIVFPLLVIGGYYESKNIRIQCNKFVYEYKKVKALKKFLKNFTLIDERPPEYVKLLEDYIVYAAIFDMYDLSIEETLKEIRLFLKVNNQ